MSFRRRIALLAAAAVAVAVVLASALTYLLVAHQLRGQIDAQLRGRSRNVPFLVRREAAKALRGALTPRSNPLGNFPPALTRCGATSSS